MPKGRADYEALAAYIMRLAFWYGQYQYRRITVILASDGWMAT